MAINVGSVSVQVVPDASQFNSRLRRDLANTPSVKVDVDTTDAQRKIDDLVRDRTVRIDVDVDTTGANAALDRLVRDRLVRIRADLDAARAQAELDRLARDRTVNIDVDASRGISQGIAGMNGLLAAGLSLGPALIPVAAAIGAAFASIGGAAAAGLSGIGVAALGFSGITGAVKALSGAETAAGAAAGKSAAAQTSAASAVAGAKAQLESAEASLANTRANAASQSIQSEERVKQAERDLADAQTQARQAQEDLTQARKDARQAMEDLNNSLIDGQLAQRQAAIDLEKARSALTALGPSALDYERAVSAVATAQDRLNAAMANPKATEAQRQAAQVALDVAKAHQHEIESTMGGTELSRKQAQLNFDQAKQRLSEIELRNKRLADQKKASDKAGVDGSQQVVAAQDNIAQANERVQDAQRGVADANRAQADQQRQSAFSIQQALAGVASAQRAVASAQTQSATSAGVASAASTKLQQAMAGLSPAGRQFATFIFGLKDEFHSIRAAAQEGLLPGVERGIKSLLPAVPALTRFVGGLARVMGDLAESAFKALGSPFWRTFFGYIGRTAGPNLRAFASILGNLAKGFAGIILAFDPFARDMTSGLVSLTKRFAEFGAGLRNNKGFQSFLAYVREQGPRVVAVFGSIVGAVGHIVASLAGIGGGILGGIGKLADIIKRIDPKILQDIYLGFAAVTVGAKAFSLAMKGVSVATAIAGGPVTLVIAALAAVGVGFVLAYRHSKTFRDFVNDKVVPVLQAVGKFVTDSVVPALKSLWNYISEKLSPAFQAARDDIKEGLQGALDNLVKAWHTKIQPALKGLQKAWQDNKPDIKKMADVVLEVVGAMVRLYGVVEKHVLPIVGTLLGDMIAGLVISISGLIDIVGTIARTFKTVLKDAAGYFKAFADKILPAAATVADAVGMHDLADKLRAAKANIDTFVEDFNRSMNKIDPKTVTIRADLVAGEGLNQGEGGTKGLTIVGSANGNVFERHSAEIAPAGAMRLWAEPETGGEAYIPLSPTKRPRSTQILRQVAGKFGYRLHEFANGGVLDLDMQLPNAAALSELVRRANETIAATAMQAGKYVQGLVKKAGPVVPPFDGSNAVSRWTQTVARALTVLHQPLTLVGAVLRRIAFESGGNPNAINLWDSNAAAGHPSQGLMQTIPGTFAAYAGPYLSRGITDGFANIYAGLNYALHRYGSIVEIDPRVRPRGYDSGGWLMPGLSMTYNGTQKPEAILTSEQWQSLTNRETAPLATYGDVYTVDAEEFFRRQRRELQEVVTMNNLRAVARA